MREQYNVALYISWQVQINDDYELTLSLGWLTLISAVR
eukprot:SAG31_NODE_7320_length_1720_cov_1.873535_2_plen_38_part_00